MREKERYLLLDSWNKPLANGVLEGPAGAEVLQIRVLDNRIDAVATQEIIQVLGTDHHNDRAVKCRRMRTRNDIVVLERLEVVDTLLRQNLRMPVRFDSYIYPLGKAKGRMAIRSVDLSCGGIAYYSGQGMQVGDIVEVVIPITEQPLIVRAKILRANDLNNGETLYATEFVNLCHDEETMIRRAVFSVQIRNEN